MSLTMKYGLTLPQYTLYPDPNSKTTLLFLAQININDHFVVQVSPTSESAENRTASKLLLLLIRSHDLWDEAFYNNDNKKRWKTKNQSVQIDPRPKLIPWENSCSYCNTQMHATKECHRRNMLKDYKQPNFPLHFHLETLQHLVDYFLPSFQKFLDLNPITCKRPTLSNINPIFLFQPSE